MKKRMKARRKGPSHAEVRPVCASCKSGNHQGCQSVDCACDCQRDEGSRRVADHLHLKNHPSEIPVTTAHVPPVQEIQGELELPTRTPRKESRPLTRPRIGAKLFPILARKPRP